MTAKDSDFIGIRDLDSQLKEYKRTYKQARMELRSVKATSHFFVQAPKMEGQLPMGPDGGLVDIHVTAFVSAIDSLDSWMFQRSNMRSSANESRRHVHHSYHR
ncbi:hypothetical protein EDB19DRAFT_2026069 [Suillus lakei]|nr:hypothetical protein EDB19DRAFT_2026069 [Suillus lakei]